MADGPEPIMPYAHEGGVEFFADPMTDQRNQALQTLYKMRDAISSEARQLNLPQGTRGYMVELNTGDNPVFYQLPGDPNNVTVDDVLDAEDLMTSERPFQHLGRLLR